LALGERRHENGVPPAQWTYDNIAYMKKQMQAPGMQPSTLGGRHLLAEMHYKWNQWLFLKMLDKGVAFTARPGCELDPVRPCWLIAGH
jgi:leucyl-tRNA synthetase